MLHENTVKPLENIKIIKAVNIPNSLFKSLQGKYFVGQTERLKFGMGLNAWGALFNPQGSRKNLFVNVVTITNYSGTPFTAQVWFNSIPPGKVKISDAYTPSNMAISIPPIPKIKIQFNNSVYGFAAGGVNAFNRIVSPNTTLVDEEDGKFIFPSGSKFLVFLLAPDSTAQIEAQIAFGWFEERFKQTRPN